MKLVRKQNTAGLDCGYRNGGLVVFSASGEPVAFSLFQTKKTRTRYVWQEQFGVCYAIASWVATVVSKHCLSRVAVELPTGASKSQRGVRAMSLAFGSTVAALACCGVEIEPVMPQELKRLTGEKGKDPVIEWALRDARLLHMFPQAKCKREHLADAAAAAFVRGLYERP